MQENWMRKAPGDVSVAATSRGYVTKAKFPEYGLRFVRFLRQQELNDRPHILIVDSHSSHLYNLKAYRLLLTDPVFGTISTPTLENGFSTSMMTFWSSSSVSI